MYGAIVWSIGMVADLSECRRRAGDLPLAYAARMRARGGYACMRAAGQGRGAARCKGQAARGRLQGEGCARGKGCAKKGCARGGWRCCTRPYHSASSVIVISDSPFIAICYLLLEKKHAATTTTDRPQFPGALRTRAERRHAVITAAVGPIDR